MNHYLCRLTAMLHHAAGRARVQPLPEGETFVRLDELLGIDGIEFPSAYRFGDPEAARLVEALYALFSAYRIYVDLPASLPLRRRYELLVGRLGAAEVAYYGAAGTWIEFCSYEPSGCGFAPEYCSCRALVEETAGVYRVRAPHFPF